VRQRAWRTGGTAPVLLAEGQIRIGCVDAGTFAPRRIPTAILDALT
jgi:acyl-CoA thioester hydrolase